MLIFSITLFLAAMSSSRSDDVTQSVRPSVPKEFLISLKIICSVSRMFQDCSVFQGSFKGVLRMFQGYPKEVSRMFQESFESVSQKFQGCFKKVSKTFQGCCKEVSRVFQGSF